MNKQSFITILLIVLMSMTGTKVLAYDIAVANNDDVTIYYNYANDGKDLEVTYASENNNIYYGGYIGNIVIPEEVIYKNRTRKVKCIGDHAFEYCSALTFVAIPNSVTSIGDSAFSNCDALTSISIPNSVTSFGSAFGGCSTLSSITIPNSVTSIEDWTFNSCSALTSVTIPNSVTTIGGWAFYGCSGLTSVIIGNSVTSIGGSAFQGCSGLTSVTIPNSVTSIGGYAFWNCNSLTSITIPNSVTNIGGNAFKGCTSLTYVVSLIKEPFAIADKSSDFRIFDLDVFNNLTLYVPVGTIEKYKSTEGWKDFLFIEEGTGPTGGGENPTVLKCANPTISFQNGKLSFTCATPDVEFHWSIRSINGENGSGSGISSEIPPSFSVSVYATKTGCLNSDTETRQFDCNTAGLKGDVDGNGVVNVADHVELSKIIMNK